MNFTKEEIEQVRNDKKLRGLAELFGLNFDEIVDEAIKETETMESPEETGTIRKPYEQPKAIAQTFLMSPEQLEKFINNYRSLIEAEKKLSYMYGVEFQDGGSGFGFPSKINEIIWDFVRIIFGDENANDIADYVFGNSNFDDVKNLYDELV